MNEEIWTLGVISNLHLVSYPKRRHQQLVSVILFKLWLFPCVITYGLSLDIPASKQSIVQISEPSVFRFPLLASSLVRTTSYHSGHSVSGMALLALISVKNCVRIPTPPPAACLHDSSTL